MVEVQVTEHHDVDVLVRDTARLQGAQQNVLVFEDAVPGSEPGLEEHADAGFEQHPLALYVLGQDRAARQFYAVVLIRFQPPGPQRPRRVAEHRAAVEPLAIAFDRRESHDSESHQLRILAVPNILTAIDSSKPLRQRSRRMPGAGCRSCRSAPRRNSGTFCPSKWRIPFVAMPCQD